MICARRRKLSYYNTNHNTTHNTSCSIILASSPASPTWRLNRFQVHCTTTTNPRGLPAAKDAAWVAMC